MSHSSVSTCYMCDRPATSSEHVPPKAFFPKAADTPEGDDLRQNLITVPACDLHNSAKSKDDEYTSYAIAFHFEGNEIVAHSSAKKFLRAIKRRRGLIGILKDNFPVIVDGRPTIGFRVDMPRVDRVFDHVARGLFYHHYGQPHQGEVKLLFPNLFDVTSTNRTLRTELDTSLRSLGSAERHGDNPSAFYYQVVDNARDGRLLIRLVLYEGFIVDCLLAGVPADLQSEA